MDVIAYQYHPKADDLTDCPFCQQLCFPFPRQDSWLCSMCYYTYFVKPREKYSNEQR